MKLNAALLALIVFAAAPAAAQADHGTIQGPQNLPSAAPPAAAEAVHQATTGESQAEHAAAGTEHGAATAEGHGEFDPMHHVQDGRTLEFQPFGEIHLPAGAQLAGGAHRHDAHAPRGLPVDHGADPAPALHPRRAGRQAPRRRGTRRAASGTTPSRRPRCSSARKW